MTDHGLAPQGTQAFVVCSGFHLDAEAPRRRSFLCADAAITLTAAAATGYRARRRFSALPIIGLLARHLPAAPAASANGRLDSTECGTRRVVPVAAPASRDGKSGSRSLS